MGFNTVGESLLANCEEGNVLWVKPLSRLSKKNMELITLYWHV